MPNGQAHLMVNLAEDEFRTYGGARADQMCEHSGAVVAGPHAKSVVIDTRAQRWLAAVEISTWRSLSFFRDAHDRDVQDQAHLIHDFQDLASITPSEYKPHSPQRNNHVPIVVL